MTVPGVAASFDIEVHTADEWSALYIDGKLDRVGDTYLSVERVYQLLGVKEIMDDAFLRGQGQREGVAQTLEEVEAYRTDRQRRVDRATELRAEAQRLHEEADQLVGGVP